MSGIFSAGGAGNVGVSGFYPVTIDDSLRFEDGSSAYLNRTPSSAGNRKTWTWSGWFKRGNLSSVEQDLFSAGNSSTDRFEFILSAAYPNQLEIYMNTGGAIGDIVTSQVFRDVSTFYHLVVAFDTTQATASNRVKIYVNGSQVTDFQTATYPSQNFNTAVNSTSGQFFSRRNYVADRYYDGYMADVYMIDGQALDPTSFGEEKDGTWIPKSYSGSYGTNGFHLEFNGNSNDTSGNGNNWTANNISAHDYVPDSPTNNFSTFNALAGGTRTLSEGNLKQYLTSTSRGGPATFTVPQSGKWYWETMANDSNGNLGVGVSQDSQTFWTSFNAALNASYYANGEYKIESGTQTSGFSSYGNGDILSLAVDADVSPPKIYFGYNGTWQNSADPAAGTGGFSLTSGKTYSPMMAHASGSSSSTATMNFGQDSTFAGATTAGGNQDDNGIGDFKYSVPSGYLALCTANLPEPTIIDGSEYFNTVLYTGNAGTQSITGVGFQPDLVWLKQRSSPTRSHRINDSVRGANKQLFPNVTNLEGTATDELTSFDSDGFSLGSANGVNGIDTYVGWNWKAGTSFSNSAGTNGATIASSGSVNTDAGFSIVSYTGTGSAGTVYHGLSSAPDMVMVKSRSNDTGDGFIVYNSNLTSASYWLDLSSTGSVSGPNSVVWNSTAPTSSVFSIGSASGTNTSGYTYIAYCFHSVDGYSKVGSYIGGGSNFPFVHTGFRPAWVLIKSHTAGYDWVLDDSARSPFNEGNATLFPNDNYVEYTGGLYGIDFLSNGFKPRTTYGQYNQSGGGYIYLAFAETPQKFANAR